jgi:hypothetical protein
VVNVASSREWPRAFGIAACTPEATHPIVLYFHRNIIIIDPDQRTPA